MASDSQNAGCTFMSRTAANSSAIRVPRETFSMGSCKRLVHSNSLAALGVQTCRSALIRLPVITPKLAIRIRIARAILGQARVHADIRFVRYAPEESRRKPEPPAMEELQTKDSAKDLSPLQS
jgi:hypothetical protein